jgi:hypothetical protein
MEYVAPIPIGTYTTINSSTNIGLFPAPACAASPSYLLTKVQPGVSVATNGSAFIGFRMAMAMWLLLDCTTNNLGTILVSQNGTTFATNVIDSSFATYNTTNIGTYMRLFSPGNGTDSVAWSRFNTINQSAGGYLGNFYYNGKPEWASPCVKITPRDNPLYLYGGLALVPDYEEIPLGGGGANGQLTYGNTNSPTTTTGWDTINETMSQKYFYRRGTDVAGDSVTLTFRGPWATLWLASGTYAGQVVIKFDNAQPTTINGISPTTYSGGLKAWDLYNSIDNLMFPVTYVPTSFGGSKDYTGGSNAKHTITVWYSGQDNASVSANPSRTTATRKLNVIGATVGE